VVGRRENPCFRECLRLCPVGIEGDLPVWAPDSKSVFYTAKVGSNVELFRVTLDVRSPRPKIGSRMNTHSGEELH
jgi:hypothetical protein